MVSLGSWVLSPVQPLELTALSGFVNHFTRQYNPEDSSEHHIHRRENLKSHISELTLTAINLI
jgi:hypothetical protein